MTLNTIFIFTLLTICTSCNAQEKNNKPKAPITLTPTVVKNFKAVALAPDFDTTLVSQYIRSIFQDSKGNFWFGTIGNGVARFDVKTLTYFSTPDGFNSKSVFAINEDKKGNIWIGTDQGLYRYNGKTFRSYTQKDGLNHIVISRKSILVDKSGNIWVGTNGGVYKYDSSADSNGQPGFSLFTLLTAINVADIIEDRNGNIWFASYGKGVYRYDGKTIANFNQKEGLGENAAGGIVEDRAGNIWFTMKGGVCRYDGKTFTEFTEKDGIGGNEVWGIYPEKSGIIWFTSRGSTTRYDPISPVTILKPFTVFTPEDGLNCCVQSMHQDKAGNMWLGTGQGLYRFDGKRFYQVKQNGPW